jgi:hypothetical protein
MCGWIAIEDPDIGKYASIPDALTEDELRQAVGVDLYPDRR